MTLNLNFNCFKNLKISKLFCCFGKKEMENNQINNFNLKTLKSLNKSNLFDEADNILLTSIINKDNKILSLTKCVDNKILCYDHKDEKKIKSFIGEKFYLLLKEIHNKVKNDKKISGCLIEVDNYQYSVVGVPILSGDEYLSTIIIKKIFIELDNIKNTLDENTNN